MVNAERHRSGMRETADVVVVGGGCMGASVAYHLARRGAGRVLLLEKDYLAAGPTGKSSAVVRQHYTVEAWVQTSQRALEVFAHFGDVVGGDAGFVRTGFVACFGAEDAEAVRTNVAMQKRHGVNVALIAPSELQTMLPGCYVDDLAVVAFHPDTGYADSIRTTGAFAARARELGAEVREGATVEGLIVGYDRVVGVRTAEGRVDAETVVLAAGPWTSGLTRTAGIELPIVPTRHPICLFHRPPGLEADHPVVSDPQVSAYYRPAPGAMTLVGAAEHLNRTRLVDPDNYHQGVEPEEIEDFKGCLTHRWPAMARSVMRGGYAGVYDTTPDDQPILGPLTEVPGVWLCLGWSGHGFKHSPVIGDLMAQWITEGQTDIDLTPFRASRFREGALVRGAHEYSAGFKR
jgi:sarcosine oxidase, subunit beta